MRCWTRLAIGLSTMGAASACAAPPTITDDAELRALATKLARCRNEGRDAGTYHAYEDCKQRAGIGDGWSER